jgi:hypothetical protein
MKKILIISLLYFICSCSNVKNIYNNERPYEGAQPNHPMLKTINATEASKTIIVFTTGFSKEPIVVKYNDTILKNRDLSTVSNVGLAGYEVVENKEDVEVSFLNTKIELIIKKENMQKYKYIYISKKEGKLIVEYSNTQNRFA